MYIATQLLIASINITPAMAGVPDLCDIVDPSTGTPTICAPHKEGAPIYKANVCCTGSTCFPTVRNRCPSGQSLYYCGLGEQAPTGAVDCYFEVPDYCDLHPCEVSFSPPIWEDTICCHWGVCTAVTLNSSECPIEDLYYSTYLAVIGYLQRQESSEALTERIALLSDSARERVIELIRRFEKQS